MTTLARGSSTLPAATQEAALLMRSLGSRERLGILGLLNRRAHTASELAEALGLERRIVDRHLRALRQAGLVRSQRSHSRRTVYHYCERDRLAQLTSTYMSVAASPPPQPEARPVVEGVDLALEVVGPPPLACTSCQSSFYLYSVLDEMNRTLEDARQIQDQLRRLSSQVLTAQEQERKRIARDLHDDTAQELASLIVRLRLLERLDNTADMKEGLGQMREMAASTLEGVRRLARNLRPRTLDDLGLVAALRWYVSDFAERWGIPVTLQTEGMDERVPAEIELVLYRIAQEALTNLAKHAQAEQGKVILQRRGSRVRLIVQDDGVGFDPDRAVSLKKGGLGLFGMEERLALVGGRLLINSSPGRGTRVEAQVPLKNRQ